MSKYKELVDEIAKLIQEREKSLEDRILKMFNGLTVDMDMKEDGRTIELSVAMPDGTLKQKQFTIPTVIYRDVYQEGVTYSEGDAVTKDGSLWIARAKEITDAPGKSDQWRLAVKRGRDAKQGGDNE